MYYKRFHCLHIKYTAEIMYEVNNNGRMSYVSTYSYCRIQGLLYDVSATC